MTELTRAGIVIYGDDSPLDSALARAERSMEKAGRRMASVGKRLSLVVTAPLTAVGAVSVKMASDAEESANKFDVVMGGAAERVRERLDTLTETIPATRSELERLAAGIQDMLVPMGVARETAAGMSADMVELAGDIASFNNVLPTEALQAMQSALAGQSEPMRRFGVDTRVTRLEQLALEKGIIRVGQELDNTTRAMAVMAAIQEDSTDAMGDAARTVDSTANQIKFLGREVKQLAEDLGRILIPAVRPVIATLNDALGFIRDLSPATQKWIVGIGAAVAALGPLLVSLSILITSLRTVIGLQIVRSVSGWIVAFTSLAAQVRTLAGALALLKASIGPAGWLALGVGAVAGAFVLGQRRMSEYADMVRELNPELEKQVEFMDQLEERLLRQAQMKPVRNIAEQVMPGVSVEVESPIPEALKALRDELDLLDRKAQALGPRFDVASDKMKAYQRTIEELVEGGVDPANQSIVRLRGELNLLDESLTALPDRGLATTTEDVTFLTETIPDVITGVSDLGIELGNTRAATQEVMLVAERMGSAFADAFASMITGAQSFAEAMHRAFEALISDIVRTIARAAVLTAILNVFTGGGYSFGNVLKGIVGLQHGGRTRQGRPYVVGERGPELFVPDTSGTVVPNDRLGGASSSNVAAEILSRVGPRPGPTNPEVAALDDWWRRLFSELVKDGRERGVRMGAAHGH